MSKEQQELVGDAYKNYVKEKDKIGLIGMDIRHFLINIARDDKFAKKWGLKIEERELSRNERSDYYYKNGNSEGIVVGSLDRPIFEEDEVAHKLFDGYNIPTKLITITYNDKTIESYE
jgi:hypothetical protein